MNREIASPPKKKAAVRNDIFKEIIDFSDRY